MLVYRCHVRLCVCADDLDLDDRRLEDPDEFLGAAAAACACIICAMYAA